MAEEVWIACARDILFYVNAFVWLFEPRTGQEMPFITRKFQDKSLLEMVDATGKHDLVIEKSRDRGVSWMCVVKDDWFARFHGRKTFLWLSRNEELVDKRGDPKSLFWKRDFVEQRLPGYLSVLTNRTKLHWENLDAGGAIDGSSTTEFAGTGDRRFAVTVDEFAKIQDQASIWSGTRDVTKSRIVPFTPVGAGNTAYDLAHNPKIKKLTIHWSDDPICARGLYSVPRPGHYHLIDKDYWTPERIKAYQFRTEPPRNPRFNLRSPWYDAECDREMNPVMIAQELDIDYIGSAAQFFDPVKLSELESHYAHAHYWEGDLDFTEDYSKIEPQFIPRGPLRFWGNWRGKDGGGRPPMDRRYVIGADISDGLGSSNSVLSVLDLLIREKVAEYSTPRIDPARFAEVAVALCKYFGGAFLVPEANGPGGIFVKRVVQLGYSNVYLRKNELSISKKVSDEYGFWTTTKSKTPMLGEFRRAWATEEYISRCRESYDEARRYIFGPNQVPEHSGSLRRDDPSGARANHGDRIIADALSWLGAQTGIKPSRIDEQEKEPPEGSIAWLREKFGKQEEDWLGPKEPEYE